MARCGDCIYYITCCPWVSPEETFPEVEKGCECFEDKPETRGLVLTFDGATGYFPKEFIIEAMREYMKMRKGVQAKELLSEIKKAVNEKAVQPGIIDVKPYILLREFDAILTNMSKAIFEEGKRYED